MSGMHLYFTRTKTVFNWDIICFKLLNCSELLEATKWPSSLSLRVKVPLQAFPYCHFSNSSRSCTRPTHPSPRVWCMKKESKRKANNRCFVFWQIKSSWTTGTCAGWAPGGSASWWRPASSSSLRCLTSSSPGTCPRRWAWPTHIQHTLMC